MRCKYLVNIKIIYNGIKAGVEIIEEGDDLRKKHPLKIITECNSKNKAEIFSGLSVNIPA